MMNSQPCCRTLLPIPPSFFPCSFPRFPLGRFHIDVLSGYQRQTWAAVMQLELAASAGALVITAIIGIVIHAAVSTGFPAIRSGELSLWKLQVGPAACPLHESVQAFSLDANIASGLLVIFRAPSSSCSVSSGGTDCQDAVEWSALVVNDQKSRSCQQRPGCHRSCSSALGLQ